MENPHTTDQQQQEEEEQRVEQTEMTEERSLGMDALPHEITSLILIFVDDESVPPCRFVCSLWNDLLRHRPVLRGEELLKRLTLVGRLSVLQWAVRHCSPIPPRNTTICENAAKGGHL